MKVAVLLCVLSAVIGTGLARHGNKQQANVNKHGGGGGGGGDDSDNAYYPAKSLDLVKNGKKSYFFSQQQKLSWMDSVSFCRAYGMDLVSIESASENAFLTQKLQDLGLSASYVWISGHKIGRSAWAWINGKSFSKYQNWQSGEPNHPTTEFCMLIIWGTWFDYTCVDLAYFICEDRPDRD